MSILEKIDKRLDEAYQLVKIAGLPDMVIKGSTGEVRTLVKKKLKNPLDLESIEMISKGEMQKLFRDIVAGKEVANEQLDEATNPLMKFKSIDAASKIMGMDIMKKGSVRENLIKAKAITSVSDSMKLINKMAEIILEEMR